MDKKSYIQQYVGWKYLSIAKLQRRHSFMFWELTSNFISHFKMDMITYLCWEPWLIEAEWRIYASVN